MRKLLLFTSFLFTSFLIQAQCPASAIVLTTQAEVNAFAATYPGCTSLLDALTISGADIIDLSGLSQIQDVQNHLIIEDNPLLVNLAGLQDVQYTSLSTALTISNNASLTSIAGLMTSPVSSLQLTVINNPNLVSLSGLSGVTDLVSFNIDNNDSLVDFTGLENIGSIDLNGNFFEVRNNAALQSFLGLQNVLFTGFNTVFISNNPVLINIDGFLASGSTFHQLHISNNVSLQQVDGLSGLETFLDWMQITGNNSLQNLNGLSNITPPAIIFEVDVINNSALTDISGLTWVRELTGDLIIDDNDALTNLAGLENFIPGGAFNNLIIRNNETLSDISALANIDFQNLNSLTIRDNAELAVCNVESVCTYIENNGTTDIQNNASGCATVQEVENSCASVNCPTTAIVLTTQAEVDAFAATYPGCTQLQFNLTIGTVSGSDIVNLTGLSQLEEIHADLTINYNPVLPNFDGLDIVMVGTQLRLRVNDNPLITAIEGITVAPGSTLLAPVVYNNTNLLSLDVFTGVNFSPLGLVVIVNNDSLLNLGGLENLAEANGGIDIRGNELLMDISALSNLSGSVGNFEISSNPALTSLSGLEGVTDVTGEFMTLWNNPLLTSLDGLNGLTNGSVGSRILVIGIGNSSALMDISALANMIPSTVQFLDISDNPNLSTCEIQFVCDYLDFTGGNDATIQNNDIGCNSIAEVEAACAAVICPLGTLTLTTQAEIDDFAITYPGCATINEDVTISGPDITDLSGLSQITAITERLTVENNPQLVSMAGLSNIAISGLNGGLVIKDNPLLTTMSNFSGVTNDGLRIDNNPLLSDLLGLSGMTEALELGVSDCNTLTDLSGLENLDVNDGSVVISDNLSLTSIVGLSGLSGDVFDGVFIVRNPLLPNLNGLEGVTSTSFMVIAELPLIENLSGLENFVGLSGQNVELFDNDALTDITALNNFRVQSGWLIRLNDNLSECSINSLCFLIEENMVDLVVDGNATGCSTPQEIEDRCTLAATDFNLDESIRLYPNPVSETLRILVASEVDLEGATVYSILGERLLITSEEKIDLSQLTSGVYFVQIQTNQGTLTRKIVKE